MDSSLVRAVLGYMVRAALKSDEYERGCLDTESRLKQWSEANKLGGNGV